MKTVPFEKYHKAVIRIGELASENKELRERVQTLEWLRNNNG